MFGSFIYILKGSDKVQFKKRRPERADIMNEIRINKLLSEMGICSRRQADKLLSEGRIRVNGRPAGPGVKAGRNAKIEIDGKLAEGCKAKPVVLAFNKPRGIVCTESEKDRAPNIIDYIGYKDRIYTIGRLDKDSEGLILLTNRGELVNLINKESHGHEKEYVVRCTDRLTEGFLKKLGKGVEIKVPVRKTTADCSEKEDLFKIIRTKSCKVRKIDDYSYDIILTQGLNRQIRRMTKALGNNVERLKRVRVMNIELGSLKEGEYRTINGSELKELERLAGLKH